jgi:hypothetical protein
MGRKHRHIELPEQVQIGSYVFDVKLDSGLSRSNLLGETHTSDQKILVHPMQHPMMLKETVLHELLHACFGVSSLTHSFSDDDEERVVAILSPWVLMMMRDNPQLLAWLTERSDG